VIANSWELPSDDERRADLCIIGAGPAGQTLAGEFVDTTQRIVLVESGDVDFDAFSNSLNAGRVDSTNHRGSALIHGRRRQFGGTTNLWVYAAEGDDGRRRARMLVPQPLDFDDRGLSHVGAWPFGREELDPYYQRAGELMELSSASFEPAAWATSDAQPLVLHDSRLINLVCHHVANDIFVHKNRRLLHAAKNVDVLINATVAELRTNEDGDRIEEAVIARPDGSRLRIVARDFVLATGGIENARLLLLSSVDNGGGLRNGHDVVGRYLMDHPEFDIGVLHPTSHSAFKQMAFYDLRWTQGMLVGGQLGFSEQVIRQESLLNMCFTLVAQRRGYGTHPERMLKAAARRDKRPKAVIQAAASAAGCPRDVAAAVRNRLLQQPYYEFRGGWSIDDRAHRFSLFEVFAAAEQSPHRDNRVSLCGRRDSMGLRRAHLQWSWRPSDSERIAQAQTILEEELKGIGVGRYESLLGPAGECNERWDGIHHPMGATRMNPDPRFGVVDENCRVHGTSNLFVAGTSVFPTSLGFSNPTFTVVALAIRLADHLRKRTRTVLAGRNETV
jgi:choline dehydrogenase-like flavoprotein